MTYNFVVAAKRSFYQWCKQDFPQDQDLDLEDYITAADIQKQHHGHTSTDVEYLQGFLRKHFHLKTERTMRTHGSLKFF